MGSSFKEEQSTEFFSEESSEGLGVMSDMQKRDKLIDGCTPEPLWDTV